MLQTTDRSDGSYACRGTIDIVTPDVVVAGAGIVGCSVAYELAKSGRRVVVVERGAIGREASWAAGGILTPVHLADYPSALADLCLRAQAGYERVVGEVRGEEDPELLRSGMLLPVLDEEDDRVVRTLEEWKRARGLPAERRTDGLFLPDVMQVRNHRMTRALAQAARRLGAEFREGAAGGAFLKVPGRVHGVRTDRGDVHAGITVLAAGAWSGLETEKLGIAMPVRPVKGQIVLVQAEPGALSHMILHKGQYLVPRADGKILIGSTVEEAGFDKTVTAGAAAMLLRRGVEMWPALAGAALLGSWAGLRPATPDRLPYIGRAPGWEGLIVATGHFRNGILLGPVTGELVRELVEGREPAELEAFRLDR
ncbi:MAG: glycine oxidase ThiO [Planctomycetes bacterium]|nr:glycine oxidase ThiO [Planctomycetota bacterium]